MISSQVLQSTIDGLKNITRREMSVIEREGKIIVSTEADRIGLIYEDIPAFVASQAENQLVAGYQYFKVNDNGTAEYVVIIKGEDEETYRIGKIAAFALQSLIVAYKERFDRDNFIKNLLLDNLLLVDIYSRAKKLKIENNVRRVVYIVESDAEKELVVLECLRGLFPTKSKDFVTAVDERIIIVVKELHEKDSIVEIENVAQQIFDKLTGEVIQGVRVAIGTVVSDLKNVSMSYKEAKMALEVGSIFETNKSIINYERLGIGRLIFQLPNALCRMFINEVLHGISIDQFDEETLTTVNKFFENNLNVSETSRQLYIHRNTLVYRLDKLLKVTGLDLRNFDDAITFQITLMVSKYMKYKNNF